MRDPVVILEKFLHSFFSTESNNQPLLLALSGGADSLCLFYCLLNYKRKHGISFHVAHVNHGWRIESKEEAAEIERMMQMHSIPFYIKNLNMSNVEGNAEDYCRTERYAFFRELSLKHGFQAVVVGHHGDDQCETVLKRILEGSHWSRWGCLKSESTLNGIKILRPFLSLHKQDIRAWLEWNKIVAFEDSTNQDVRFLRARMRQEILPELNKMFGKNTTSALVSAGQDALELTEYFDEKIQSYLQRICKGPFGIYLDLSNQRPESVVEIKYLIKKICELQGFYLSRPVIGQIVDWLQSGEANKHIEVGEKRLVIDRRKIFILLHDQTFFEEVEIAQPCAVVCDGWRIEVEEVSHRNDEFSSDWNKAWRGQLSVVIPKGVYTLTLANSNTCIIGRELQISKWWNNHKVPIFLRKIIPVILCEKMIMHEFLTGKYASSPQNKSGWIRIKLMSSQ